MRSTVFALVAAGLIAAGPALAGGGERGDWELGGYVGYGWLDDYGGWSPGDDVLYGGRLGYFLTSHWNLEFSAQRLPTEANMGGLMPNTDVELDAFRFNALYNFAPGMRFRPFLTAGLGSEKTDIAAIGSSTDIGFNLGGGFRWYFTPRFLLRGDGRFVSVKVGEQLEDGQSNVEATVGLAVSFGGGGGEAPAVVEAPPPNQAPNVTVACERPEILPGESVRIVATATDPEGDPLTYAWTADAGRVTGSGASATLDFTGATPPASATVTVTVSDSRGNTSSATCGVRLLEPARPAEAVSCLSAGFPRNLSRLNNVDKACLDDVVQRLKADPRARVVIIGHADRAERTPDALGKQRADAVEDYLEQAGIEAARMTTRSAGSTRPVDPGTGAGAEASNRRVEVWFVPEGATAPE